MFKGLSQKLNRLGKLGNPRKTDIEPKISNQLGEVEFYNKFNALISEGKPEKTLTYLIEALPILLNGPTNRKEKLKHLTFAGRRLQNANLGKYGVEKLRRKSKRLRTIAEKYGLPSRNLYLDFGCGAHEPLALSTYWFANGFSRCIANDFLPISSPEYAALSMYDIVTYLNSFPEDFLAFEKDVDAFRDRISRFDLNALLAGDFEKGTSGLAGKVDFVSSDILQAGIESESVSYLTSFAVFEHVTETERVWQHLFDITEPGGLHFHFIDLADHRAYRLDGTFNQFSFLTEEQAPPGINRLRASEQIGAIKLAGFQILDVKQTRVKIPEKTRDGMLPKWRAMSEEDQETTKLRVVLRKP